MKISCKKVLFALILHLYINGFLETKSDKDDIKSKVMFIDKFLDFLNLKDVGKSIGFLCWRKVDILQLIRLLNNRFLTNNNYYKGLPSSIEFESLTKDHYIFIADSQCDFFERLMKMAESNYLFQKTHTWVIFGNLIQGLQSPIYYYPIESKVFIIENKGNETLNISRIFMRTKFSPAYTIEAIADWSMHRNKLIMKNVSKSINFMGEILRVSYALIYYNESIKHLTDHRGGIKDLIPKMNYAVFEHVCFCLNATHFPIVRANWGVFNHTTGYFSSGMFLDLQVGNADVAGNTNFMTGPRIDNFTYLVNGDTTHDFVYWFFINPRLSSTTNIWALPFQTYTWWCVVGIISIFLFGLAVIAKMEIKIAIFNRNPETDSKRFGVGDALDVIYAIVTQKAIPLNLKSLSGHFALYTLNILALFLFTAYSAKFVVLLQSPSHSINDFEALFRSGIQMGAENVSYNRIYYEEENNRTPHELRLKLYNSKIRGRQSQFYMDEETGMRKVQEEWFAFQILRSSAYTIVQKTFNDFQRKSLRSVDTFIGGPMVYLCLPKNSPYYEVISTALLKLKENGMMNREHRMLYPEKGLPDYTASVFVSISLEEIYFVYLIFFGGIIFSLLIFVGEHFSYRFEQMQKLANGDPTFSFVN